MNYETIHFEVKDQAAFITLNRPDVANGLSMTWGKELMDVAIRCDEDPGIGLAGRNLYDRGMTCESRPRFSEINSSKSRPELGFIKVKVSTLNQAGEAVQIYIGNLVGLRQPQI